MAEANTVMRKPENDALAKLAEIPPAGSEERDFWLEAAEQHGVALYKRGVRPRAAHEDAILKLMSEARKQGQRDVLGAGATPGAGSREHIKDETAAVVLAHHVLAMQMGTAMGQRARQLARQMLGIPDHGELAGCTALATNGTLRIIPADEPVFLLRGQDVVAADVVRFWVEQVENIGAEPDIVAVALEHADRMEAWPVKKVPDLSPGLAQREAARG